MNNKNKLTSRIFSILASQLKPDAEQTVSPKIKIFIFTRNDDLHLLAVQKVSRDTLRLEKPARSYSVGRVPLSHVKHPLAGWTAGFLGHFRKCSTQTQLPNYSVLSKKRRGLLRHTSAVWHHCFLANMGRTGVNPAPVRLSSCWAHAVMMSEALGLKNQTTDWPTSAQMFYRFFKRSVCFSLCLNTT